MTNNYERIPASEFEFVGEEGRLHDKKLDTKPVSYLRDAFNRFVRNKSSVVAACIICILILYAIFAPMLCQNNYTLSLTDTMYLNYAKLPPRSKLLGWMGLDGCSDVTVNESTYNSYRAIGIETGRDVILEVYKGPYNDPTAGSKTMFYDIKVDNYAKIGMLSMTFTTDQYEAILAWEKETGIKVLYPIITDSKQSDANIWYETNKKGAATLDGEGNFKPIYKLKDGEYVYGRVTGTSDAKSYVCRVSLYDFFIYRYGFEPSFIFGTDGHGADIFTRLANGARFSFMLAICISSINMIIGAIYGAIEGYYGGAVDMIMERVSDILSGIPFSVVTVLFQLHFSKKVGVVGSLIFAFVLTGWIGMASLVRMQFYRFKGQEYVLASRTLGASDWRIMFKHIFPNSLGTIVTSCVLVIPGVIFSESSLTYLGIVNLESSTMTSVGTMLANGREFLSTFPYIIFFPSLFISLLEISFNLFGNGLRDAFNPSLRGAE